MIWGGGGGGVDGSAASPFLNVAIRGETFTFKDEISHPQKQRVNLDKLEQKEKHIQSFILAHGCPESYPRTLNGRYLQGPMDHFMSLNSAHNEVLLFF